MKKVVDEPVSADRQPFPSSYGTAVIVGCSINLRISPGNFDAFLDANRTGAETVSDLYRRICNARYARLNYRADTAAGESPGQPAGEPVAVSEAGRSGTAGLTTGVRVFIMNDFRRLAQGKSPAHEGQSFLTTSADDAGSDRF